MSDHNNPIEQLSPASELRRLLNELCDGSLSESDFEKLSDLLLNSESSRWQYIHTVHLREGLKKWAKSQGTASASDVVEMLRSAVPSAVRVQESSEADEHEVSDAAMAGALQFSHVPGSTRDQVAVPRRWLKAGLSSRWSKLAYAAAAMLLVSFATWQFLPPAEPTKLAVVEPVFQEEATSSGNAEYTLYESQTVVARVASLTPDVSWSRGKEPADFLMRLRPGDVIGIDQGLAKIEFSDGAFVLLHAPGALQINSGSSARLVHGRVAGRAENGNFVLTTPSATVVDIGTEFGIDVGHAGTDVTVFEGEVHVHGMLSDRGSSLMRRLKQGMSVRIDPKGLPQMLLESADTKYSRQFFREAALSPDQLYVSLLDLVSGHKTAQPRIAGSIDPATGFWGRPPWIDPDTLGTQRGDTQFTQTDWNPMVDGVFIPRSNAREMQIDSDGHMVYLPANSGSTWGPIWARRRSEFDLSREFPSDSRHNYWGSGTLTAVRDRLQISQDGLMGLHANVGITFDLDAVRDSQAGDIEYLKAVVVTLNTSAEQELPADKHLADLRVFVDGRLRYSRLEFGRDDGDAHMMVPLSKEDRFLTIVTTDAGGDPAFDHVVLIDPVLQLYPKATAATLSDGG